MNLVVTEAFIRGRKINISLVFITQSYFNVPKDVRLNTTHFLSHKFQIKENFNILLRRIHLTLILKILIIIYKNSTNEPYSFLVNDTTLA